MTATDLTPLDPRFPIRVTMAESIFWTLATDPLRGRPDSPAALGLAARARAQREAMRHEERYVAVTEPIPTVAERPGDWFNGDPDWATNATEFVDAYQPASARDMDRDFHRAERRHPVGRIIRRALGRGTEGEQ